MPVGQQGGDGLRGVADVFAAAEAVGQRPPIPQVRGAVLNADAPGGASARMPGGPQVVLRAAGGVRLALFGVSESAAGRNIDHLDVSFFLQQQAFRTNTALIVDGTWCPPATTPLPSGR